MTGHRHVAATLGRNSDAPGARRPVRPLLTTGIALVGAATLLILQPGADPPTVAIPAPTQSAETSTWLGDSIPAMAGEVPGETLFDLPAPSYWGAECSHGHKAHSFTSASRTSPRILMRRHWMRSTDPRHRPSNRTSFTCPTAGDPETATV